VIFVILVAKELPPQPNLTSISQTYRGGTSSPREGWSCNGDDATRTSAGLPKGIDKTQANAMLQAQFDIVREKHVEVPWNDILIYV